MGNLVSLLQSVHPVGMSRTSFLYNEIGEQGQREIGNNSERQAGANSKGIQRLVIIITGA